MSSYTSDVLKFHKEQLEKRKKMEQESRELMGLVPELEEMLETKGKLAPKVKEIIDEYRKKLYREAVNIRKRDAIVNNNTEAFQGNSSAINEYIRLYDSTKNDVEKNVEDLYYTKITEIIAKKDAEKIYADILAFDPVDLSYLKEFVFNFTTYKNNLKELRSKNVSYATFIEILKNMIEKNLAVISTFKANNAGLNNNNNNMAAPVNNTRVGLNNTSIPGVIQPQQFADTPYVGPAYQDTLRNKGISVLPPRSEMDNVSVDQYKESTADDSIFDDSKHELVPLKSENDDDNDDGGDDDDEGEEEEEAPFNRDYFDFLDMSEYDQWNMETRIQKLKALTQPFDIAGIVVVDDGTNTKRRTEMVYYLYELVSRQAPIDIDNDSKKRGIFDQDDTMNYIKGFLDLTGSKKVEAEIKKLINENDEVAIDSMSTYFFVKQKFGSEELKSDAYNYIQNYGVRKIDMNNETSTCRACMIAQIEHEFLQLVDEMLKFGIKSDEGLDEEKSKLSALNNGASSLSKYLNSIILDGRNGDFASNSFNFKLALPNILGSASFDAAVNAIQMRLRKCLYVGCRNVDLYLIMILIRDFVKKPNPITGKGFDKKKKKSEKPVSSKYYIDQDELDSGVLTVKYLKNRHNGPIRNTLLSKKLQGVIKDIIDGNQYDPNEYKQLSQGDKYILNRFLTLIDKNDAIKDVIDEVKERVHILLGSISAGNTSDLNIAELKELLIFCKNNNILRAGMVSDIMKDLGIN